MEEEPINQNYLIGCDTIENSPSLYLPSFSTTLPSLHHGVIPVQLP